MTLGKVSKQMRKMTVVANSQRGVNDEDADEAAECEEAAAAVDSQRRVKSDGSHERIKDAEADGTRREFTKVTDESVESAATTTEADEAAPAKAKKDEGTAAAKWKNNTREAAAIAAGETEASAAASTKTTAANIQGERGAAAATDANMKEDNTPVSQHDKTEQRDEKDEEINASSKTGRRSTKMTKSA